MPFIQHSHVLYVSHEVTHVLLQFSLPNLSSFSDTKSRLSDVSYLTVLFYPFDVVFVQVLCSPRVITTTPRRTYFQRCALSLTIDQSCFYHVNY